MKCMITNGTETLVRELNQNQIYEVLRDGYVVIRLHENGNVIHLNGTEV